MLRYRPRPAVIGRRLDDEFVLVNLDTDRIFTVSLTGARFWELAVAGLDLTAIRTQMLREFAVTDAEIDRAIDTFSALLHQEGLLDINDAG
jgi:hypothetical protein